MNDFDFGFTIVDETEQVQEKTNLFEEEIDKLQRKCDNLYDAIQPLLDNLQKNPDSDYIKWVGKDRVEKIDEFRLKLQSILDEGE
jgi:prefoldin subunit 5